jgi:hypothetical protein
MLGLEFGLLNLQDKEYPGYLLSFLYLLTSFFFCNRFHSSLPSPIHLEYIFDVHCEVAIHSSSSDADLNVGFHIDIILDGLIF